MISLNQRVAELCTKGCVLVVEDEYLIRFYVAQGLTAAGFKVVQASNAAEAMDYVKTAGDVDLVLTDVKMPGAMDGIDLARWVKTERPDVAVFIASGTEPASSTAGLGQFFSKPYSLEKVISRAAQILQEKQGIPCPVTSC